MLKNFYYTFSQITWHANCINVAPCYTEYPTRYRTRHFFNNFTTNEDIATKFEADVPHCVRNVKENNVLLFKFRCNVFIGVRIIKEMPGSVASSTSCTLIIIFISLYISK